MCVEGREVDGGRKSKEDRTPRPSEFSSGKRAWGGGVVRWTTPDRDRDQNSHSHSQSCSEQRKVRGERERGDDERW